MAKPNVFKNTKFPLKFGMITYVIDDWNYSTYRNLDVKSNWNGWKKMWANPRRQDGWLIAGPIESLKRDWARLSLHSASVALRWPLLMLIQMFQTAIERLLAFWLTFKNELRSNDIFMTSHPTFSPCTETQTERVQVPRHAQQSPASTATWKNTWNFESENNNRDRTSTNNKRISDGVTFKCNLS